MAVSDWNHRENGDRTKLKIDCTRGFGAILTRLTMPWRTIPWIPYFLGKQGGEVKRRVDEEFFRAKLDDGNCLEIVDGLEPRLAACGSALRAYFEHATQALQKCDDLVAPRPQTNEGRRTWGLPPRADRRSGA
jgi:hypothetical protein